MDEDIVDEKKCPICNKDIRSDANIHEYCKLCGMGIPEPSVVPKLQTKDRIEYFCCDWCFSVYKKNIA
ncbi:MAG: hypothetical protein JSW06_01745 [Thermoplasmatales archaeon]|nr:MAG: hypothetical protein JSW06_01745 [Thermoplasmatales archaeon]